ncbi:hypothetical protein BX616_004798 [Lobosporangium transversale]|nr:hypothetical protein BX616_004798 [Lobosporangium transversale]
MTEGKRILPLSTLNWIQSERKSAKAKTIQTRLIPFLDSHDQENCDPINIYNLSSHKGSLQVVQRHFSSTSASATSTGTLSSNTRYLKQSLLTNSMAKDKGDSSGGDSLSNRDATTKVASKRMTRGSSKASNNETNNNPEPLAAIQQKVSKFQPKIDSLLPRMLNKNTPPATSVSVSKARTNEKTLPETSKPATGSSKAAAVAAARATKDPQTSSKLKSPAEVTNKSTNNIIGKSTNPATPTQKNKTKKASNSPITSIASLIPKGSRAKPLPPQKAPDQRDSTGSASVATSEKFTSPARSTRSRIKDQPEQVIILSSSIPSSPSHIGNVFSWEETENNDVSATSPEEVDIGLVQPKEDVSRAPSHDEDHNTGLITSQKARSSHRATATPAKIPSIISINSAQSDTFASVTPSVHVDRITDWMGEVKEALRHDTDDATKPLQQTALTPRITEPRTVSTKKQEEPAVMEPKPREIRKPVFSRPPPAIPRHQGATTNSKPPQLPDPASAPQDTVISSLGEEDSFLDVDAVPERSTNKEKRVLVEGSFPSVPPVPLFHEASNMGDSKTELALASATSSKVTTNLDPYNDDDISTVVGQQPTQGSIMEASSLPSFVYAKDKNEEIDEEEIEKEEEYYANVREPSLEPSLPSALTSSCLQELGLRKRRHSEEGPGNQGKRQVGRERSPAHEDENSSSHEEDIILAQEDAFPQSIASVPVSFASTASPIEPSSYSVLEAPEYAYALPERTRQSRQGQDQSQLGQGNWATQQSRSQDTHDSLREIRAHSFPSPPSQVSFTSLPTMPTMPSMETFQSQPEEGSLSQPRSSGDENQIQSIQSYDNSWSKVQSGQKRSTPSEDQSITTLPSPLPTLPTMPSFPLDELSENEAEASPSLIVIDSQSQQRQTLEDDVS